MVHLFKHIFCLNFKLEWNIFDMALPCILWEDIYKKKRKIQNYTLYSPSSCNKCNVQKYSLWYDVCTYIQTEIIYLKGNSSQTIWRVRKQKCLTHLYPDKLGNHLTPQQNTTKISFHFTIDLNWQISPSVNLILNLHGYIKFYIKIILCIPQLLRSISFCYLKMNFRLHGRLNCISFISVVLWEPTLRGIRDTTISEIKFGIR